MPRTCGTIGSMPDRYGGYDLQNGDADASRTWGGQTRVVHLQGPAATNSGSTHNVVQAPDYVRRLQRDLRELGFALQHAPSGRFDLRTEWAVREFQIYSKMDRVATNNLTGLARHAENLSQLVNTDVYQGPVSGVVNARTRGLLQMWIERRWRCPVVVESYMNIDNTGRVNTLVRRTRTCGITTIERRATVA